MDTATTLRRIGLYPPGRDFTREEFTAFFSDTTPALVRARVCEADRCRTEAYYYDAHRVFAVTVDSQFLFGTTIQRPDLAKSAEQYLAMAKREIPTVKYAIAMEAILRRAPVSHRTSSPVGIVRPGPDWKLGMVSWIAANTHGIYLLQRGAETDPIVALDTVGAVVKSWGRGLFATPHSLRVDSAGNVWATDAKSSRLLKFSSTGDKLLQIDVGGVPENCRIPFCGVTDVAFAPNGAIFVADGYRNARIIEFTQNGEKVREWGSAGAGPGEFQVPHSIVIADSVIYVADRGNHRVQKFDLKGRYLGEWGWVGRAYSLAVSQNGIWVGSLPLAEPASAAYLLHIDRRTGNVLEFVSTDGVHGIGIRPNGEVLSAPGPNRIPQRHWKK